MTTQKDNLNTQTWLEEYGDYLFSYAFLRIKDKHIAEDLVQETLLAGITAKNTFSNQSTLRTWLTGILKHKLADHFRQRGREIPMSDYFDQKTEIDLEYFFYNNGHWKDESDIFFNPEKKFQQKEFCKIFHQCLSGLKPMQAEVFLAKEIHGLSTQEISKCLFLSPNNVSVLMHRARLSLHRCLRIHWL